MTTIFATCISSYKAFETALYDTIRKTPLSHLFFSHVSPAPNPAQGLESHRFQVTSNEWREMIAKEAKELNQDWNNFLKPVTEMIMDSVNDQPDQELKDHLKLLLDKLSCENLSLFFDHLLGVSLKEDIPGLPRLPLEVLNPEKLENLLKRMSDRFTNPQQWIETFAEGLPDEEQPPVTASTHRNSNASSTNVITSFFPNLGRIFMRAFDLFDSSRPPESLYEYGVLVTLYMNFFSIPYHLFMALNAVIADPLTVLATAMTLIGLSIGSLYSYLRWMKKCPTEVMYCDNLSKKFESGEMVRTIGNEDKYEQVKGCLGIGQLHKKNTVVLVGKAGVGKTEFMNGLAERLPGYQVFKFKNQGLFNHSHGANAGERMDMAFKEVRGFEDKVIFCFDEMGDGIKNEGFSDYLKLVLPNEKIRFITAMTQEQWDKIKAEGSNGDRSFEERFTPIFLDPPDEEQTLRILSESVKKYSDEMIIHHEALRKIIILTNKLRPDHAQPRSAIDALHVLRGRVQQFNVNTYTTHELIVARDALKNLQSFSISADSPFNNPNDAGRNEHLKLIKEARQKITDLEEIVENQKRLTRKMTKYLRYFKLYQQEQVALASLLSGKTEDLAEGPLKIMQNKFLFANFFALPKINAKTEKLSKKLNKDIYLQIDERMVSELIK